MFTEQYAFQKLLIFLCAGLYIQTLCLNVGKERAMRMVPIGPLSTVSCPIRIAPTKAQIQ
jgi:hypothetical protein